MVGLQPSHGRIYAYYSITTSICSFVCGEAASQPSNIILKPLLLRALTAYCSISNPDELHSTLPGLRIEGLGQSLQSLKPWTAGLDRFRGQGSGHLLKVHLGVGVQMLVHTMQNGNDSALLSTQRLSLHANLAKPAHRLNPRPLTLKR